MKKNGWFVLTVMLISGLTTTFAVKMWVTEGRNLLIDRNFYWQKYHEEQAHSSALRAQLEAKNEELKKAIADLEAEKKKVAAIVLATSTERGESLFLLATLEQNEKWRDVGRYYLQFSPDTPIALPEYLPRAVENYCQIRDRMFAVSYHPPR